MHKITQKITQKKSTKNEFTYLFNMKNIIKALENQVKSYKIFFRGINNIRNSIKVIKVKKGR